MDKSTTHYRVRKNGIESWMAKQTVEQLGRPAVQKDGWEFLPEEPIEVKQLRSKKAEAKAIVEESEEEVLIDSELIEAKTEKSKKGRKPVVK